MHDGSRPGSQAMVVLERSMRWVGGKKARIARSILFLSLFYFSSAIWSAALDSIHKVSQYAHTAWRVQDVAEDFRGPFTQTADGYFWFGTASGLVRFDGVSFVPYAPSGLKLPSRGFKHLLGARDGSLWIGTTSGLARLKDGKLQWYSDPARHIGIGSILEDHEGTIWVTRYHVPATEGPLCRVEGTGLHCYWKNDGIPVHYGLGLTEDSAGNLWFGSKVLCRWRAGSVATTYLNEIANRRDAGDGILDVATGPSGTVWAATDGVGRDLGVRYFSGGKWASYIVPGFDGSKVNALAMHVDRNGSLWIGTDNSGLYRVHSGIAEHYGTADGLSGKAVHSFYEDREGNLWVLTDAGIDMFRDTPVVSYSTREGLSQTYIFTVLALQDGSLWVGNGSAIDILAPGGYSKLSAAEGLPGQDVEALFQDHRGVVWLGLDGKLMAYEHGRFKEFKRPDGSSLAEGDLSAITEDANHTIWVLTSGRGLYQVEDQFVNKVMSLNSDNRPSGFLAADHEGGIWVGSLNGTLTYYRAGQAHTIASPAPDGSFTLMDMAVDHDDSLLLSTSNGLFRWDSQHWNVLNHRNGLPGDAVSTVIRDNGGALWLFTQRGLVKIEQSEYETWRRQPESKLAVEIFDRSDGARPRSTFQPVQPVAARTKDGKLWFAASEVLQMVDPRQTYRNRIPPPVHIEKVIADHSDYGFANGIRLAPLTRDLEIDYTALSFAVPQKVVFRYMLEGHDVGWQEAGTRRRAFYNDLRPGRYRFRVIAANNSGVWNEIGATLEFSIAPAYWQTNWFRALCALAFVATLWTVYQLRVNALKQRQTVLEQHQALLERHQTEIRALNEQMIKAQEAERMRISGELHDGVLQQITSLTLRLGKVRRQVPPDSEATATVDGLQQQLIQIGTDIRHISHELHPALLQEAGLPAALEAYCEEFSKVRDLPVSCETDESVRELSPGAALCLYRIAQEALGNASKYSEARKVDVRLTRSDGRVHLSVSDDGVGCAPNQIGKSGGLGLINMRERVLQLSGTFEFDSEPGRGATVRVSVPFRPA